MASKKNARGATAGDPSAPTELERRVAVLTAEQPAEWPPAPRFSNRPQVLRSLSLGRLIGENKGLLWLSILFIVLTSVLQQVGPKLTQIAIDEGISKNDLLVVFEAAGAMAAALVILALSQKWMTQVTGRLAARAMRSLRVRTFRKLNALSMDFYERERSGVLLTRMTSDIENLQQMLQDGVAQLAVQGLTMLVIIGFLVSLNPELALITVVISIPALLLLSIWFRSASTKGYRLVRDRIAEVVSHLSESLHGVRVVTLSNRHASNVTDHRRLTRTYWAANIHMARINGAYGPGTLVIGFVAQAVILAIGGSLVSPGVLSVGDLVAFLLYLTRLFQPIQLLVQQYNVVQQAQSSIAKLRELLDQQPTVVEADEAAPLRVQAGAIRFERVGFAYAPDRVVLEDVSLDVRPGETLALVGATGAGKSTLAKLLKRYYDPTEGRILVDGVDIATVTLASLRRGIGEVPQEPFLFSGTIRDNLVFGVEGVTESQIVAAMRAVGLDTAIAALPLGIETMLQERGASLAAGQRQLVALARAFLADPRILVLDEATSNLDLQSELVVQSGLDALLADRTAIIVAHRLSTARLADRVAVVAYGGVAELGSHEELMAAEGIYASMYSAWSAGGGH